MTGPGMGEIPATVPEAAPAAPDSPRWRLFVETSIQTAVAQIVVVAIVVPMLWQAGDRGNILAWGAAAVLVGAMRTLACVILLRRGWTAEPWARRGLAGLSLLSGLLWGLTPFILGVDSGTAESTATVVIGAGMVMGAAVTSALYQPAMFAFATPLLGGLILSHLLQGSTAQAWMGALIVLFFLLAWLISWRHRGEILRRLRSEAELLESHRRIAVQAAELRQLAERNREEAVRANAASEAKSRFLANMSHEIRTPLNGVLGMAAALSQSALTAAQRQMVAVIEQAGSGLLHIIDDILDLSRIEAGKLTIDPRPFDLPLLLRALEAGQAEEARRKGLRLTVEPAPSSDGRFLADANRLRQILQNLTGNAVKFTRSGGIRVRVACIGSDGAVLPQLPAPGPASLRFEVEDTGIGIAADKLQAVFQPFEQAEAGTTRRYGGSGLGLSICHQLIGMMGGEIGVDSRPGEGSRFWFRLPVECLGPASAEPGDAQMAAPPRDSRLRLPAGAQGAGARDRPMRILAAEDSPTNRLVLQALLAPTGAEVAMARDGAEVLAAWQDGAFDLVLMDVHMPVLDGVEATRELRRREAAQGRRRTPVIALTANVMAHQMSGYRAAGMDSCIGKPIERDALLAAIRTAAAGAPADRIADEAAATRGA